MKVRFQREARTSPDTIGGVRVAYAAAKRHASKWPWYLALALVLSPAIYLVLSGLVGLFVRAASGVVFFAPQEVRAAVNGRIAEIHVRPGDEVSAGAVLARLEDPELDARIASTRARASDAQWLAAAFEPGGRRAERLEELALEQRVLRLQEERRDSFEALVREGAATAAELREAQAAVHQARAAVLRVQGGIAARGGAPAQQVQGPEDAALRAELERLEIQHALLTVRAAQDGRVLDVYASAGEFVTMGTPLLVLGDAADPQVVAYTDPGLATKLRVGSRATIEFPDGHKELAAVTEPPMLTRRMPADLVDPFGLRPMTVVLHLQSERPWPAHERIHGLPVTVRFHYDWEPASAERSAAQ